MKIYNNGVLVDSKRGWLNDNGGNLTIGSTYLNKESVDSDIDEVRVYNRVLTDTEIMALYENIK